MQYGYESMSMGGITLMACSIVLATINCLFSGPSARLPTVSASVPFCIGVLCLWEGATLGPKCASRLSTAQIGAEVTARGPLRSSDQCNIGRSDMTLK